MRVRKAKGGRWRRSRYDVLEVRVYPIRKTTPGRLPHSEAVKKFNGRDALLRVRDGKPNTDAEHRVPTESGLQAQTNFFTAPLC